MIKFACPSCRKSMRVDDTHAGKKGKCPKCGNAILVPEQSTLIEFDCATCGHTIRVTDSYAGKTGRCPKCKNSVSVPAVHTEPLAPERPAQSDSDEGDTQAEAPYEDATGPDRRRILIVAGIVALVLVGIGLAILLWPSGSGSDADPMASRQSQRMEDTESQPEQTKTEIVPPDTSDAIRLRFTPSPGTQRTMRVTNQLNTLHQQNDQSMEMTNTQSITVDLEVQESRNDGAMAIRVSLAQIQVKVTTQDIENEYDSAKAESKDSAMAGLYAPFVGKPFTIVVSGQGELVDSGLDGLYRAVAKDRMEAEDKRMSDAQAIERLDQQFGSREGRIQNMKTQLEAFPLLGTEQMRTLLGDLIVPLPSVPIQDGTSWPGSILVQAGMNVDVPATYSLTALDEDAWLIEAHGERRKEEAPFVYQAGSTTVTNDLAGPSDVALIVDRHTGWLQRKEQKDKLSGQMVRTQDGKQDANSVSDVTMELTTTVERVE